MQITNNYRPIKQLKLWSADTIDNHIMEAQELQTTLSNGTAGVTKVAIKTTKTVAKYSFIIGMGILNGIKQGIKEAQQQ